MNGQSKKERQWWRKPWGVAAIVLGVLTVIGLAIGEDDDEATPNVTTTSTTPENAPTTTTEATDPTGTSTHDQFVELVEEHYGYFVADSPTYEEAQQMADAGDPAGWELLDVAQAIEQVTNIEVSGSWGLIETGMHPDGGGWAHDNSELADRMCGVAVSATFDIADELLAIEVLDKFGGRLARCSHPG